LFDIQLFPQRTSLLKLSIARHEKGRGGELFTAYPVYFPLLNRYLYIYFHVRHSTIIFCKLAKYFLSFYCSLATLNFVFVLWNGDGAGICSPSFLYLEATTGTSYLIHFTLIFVIKMVEMFVLYAFFLLVTQDSS
jgi:hypothetical protein